MLDGGETPRPDRTSSIATAHLPALDGPERQPWPSANDLRGLIERSMPGCRPDTSLLLADLAVVRPIAREEMIFEQGEPVPMTLLIRGYGAFRRTTVDGTRLTVGIANPGEVYGITAIAATVASVELVALTDGLAASWKGSEVRTMAATDAGFAVDVIDRLALFLTIITEKVDGFLHQDARRRVIRVLARHRDLFFGDPAILSRAHLPGLVGTSREMTGRVLRELERDGTLLRVGRTGLQLVRPDQLDPDAARPSRRAS